LRPARRAKSHDDFQNGQKMTSEKCQMSNGKSAFRFPAIGRFLNEQLTGKNACPTPAVRRHPSYLSSSLDRLRVDALPLVADFQRAALLVPLAVADSRVLRPSLAEVAASSAPTLVRRWWLAL
jgi:hypothetical protein